MNKNTSEPENDIVIIEDEIPARALIESMIHELRPNWKIVAHLGSIDSAINWFKSHNHPTLAFVDIQLSDGLSFEIFDQVQYEGMIIFTTAYDEYALRAFQVNSIDYLLKPIRKKDLEQAITKYEKWIDRSVIGKNDQKDISDLLKKFTNREPVYRTRFLIKKGDNFVILPTSDVAYFYTMGHSAGVVSRKNSKEIVDFTLDELDEQLDPGQFFRISRQMIVRIDAIRKIHRLFNGRLSLDLIPRFEGKATVSRQRVNDFKEWIDR